MPATPPRLALVVCPSIGDEHIASYRVLGDFARCLQDRGIAVLELDYRGVGESEGVLEGADLAGFVADVRLGLDHLAHHAPEAELGLLGVRLGALVASAVAGEDARVSFVACWAPVIDASRNFRMLLRRQVLSDAMYGETPRRLKEEVAKLEAGGQVDIGGYMLGGALYLALCRVELRTLSEGWNGRVFAGVESRDFDSAVATLQPPERGDDPERISIEPFDCDSYWSFPPEGSRVPYPHALADATMRWLLAIPAGASVGRAPTKPVARSHGTKERVVQFASGDHQIFGIWHQPPAGVRLRRTAVVLVNSRVEFRLGPHRVSILTARRLAAAGFPVLRFDFAGNGDTPGDDDYPTMDSFPEGVTADAARFAGHQSDVDSVALGGVCMGARNALFSAANIEQVQLLALLGMPFTNATPFAAQDEEMETRSMSQATARKALWGYLARLADPQAWSRLLRGRTDFGVIARSAGTLLGRGRNQLFTEPVFLSLEAFAQPGQRILFMFGSNDVFWPDFHEGFERAKVRLPLLESQTDIQMIGGGNHTLSRVSWQRECIASVVAWMEASEAGLEGRPGPS